MKIIQLNMKKRSEQINIVYEKNLEIFLFILLLWIVNL